MIGVGSSETSRAMCRRVVVATIGLILLGISGMPGAGTALAAKSDRIPVASGARLGGDGERTRFVADLSVPVRFNAYVLPDPFRIIIDMEEINFQLPDGLGSTGRGLIDAYRYGLFDVGKSRIVMDANAPVNIEQSFVLDPKDGSPARLVIDIVRTDRETFFRKRQDAPTRAADELGAKIASLGEPMRPDPIVPPVVPRAKPKPADRVDGGGGKPRRRVIVLDPGHGGVDPGAIGNGGTSEKTVVFQFAQEVRKRLRKSGSYVVLMTRSKDTFVRLRDRVNFARQNEADLFIAVHADSLKRGEASGATVYTLSETASDREAGELAAKENRADIIAGVDLGGENDEVTGILIDLAQRETNNQSVYFAKTLVKTMDRVARMTSRPHRSAGFRVLKAPDVPSILLELGYLSNKGDEKLLLSKAWRAKTAEAVVDAVDEYFSARVARGK